MCCHENNIPAGVRRLLRTCLPRAEPIGTLLGRRRQIEHDDICARREDLCATTVRIERRKGGRSDDIDMREASRLSNHPKRILKSLGRRRVRLAFKFTRLRENDRTAAPNRLANAGENRSSMKL